MKGLRCLLEQLRRIDVRHRDFPKTLDEERGHDASDAFVFDCGDEVYTIQPGVYITTMLSVINTQNQELARFDPDHYRGRRIDPKLIEKGKETISTFGHGSHACPAQKFSHNMCKVLLSVLLAEFDFSTPDSIIEPSSAQMGGVSRASGDVVVRYSRKSLV